MTKHLVGALAVVCLISSFVSAQGARFGDANPTQTTTVIPGTSGLIVKVIPGATIEFCNWPANAVPCTNKATTYTDYTLQTPCPTSTQVVLAPTTTCTGTADIYGNWGVWVAPGLYQFTFTYQGNNYGPFFAIPTGNGVSTLSCPNAAGLAPGTAAVGAMTSPTAFNCDNKFLTDLQGNFTAQSGRFIGPVNGFVGLIGGGTDPGASPTFKLSANEVRFLAPTTVPTPYYKRPPNTPCALGQVDNVTNSTTDANGDTVVTYGCLTPSNGQVIQVNGTPILTESPANFQDTATATWSNPSAGNIQVTVTGASGPTIGAPTAPTLANNNAAGARSITYLIQGCEDGPTCAKHTVTSSTQTIANANASPQVLMTAYGDTLYGPRCYDVYVTADSGARTGVPGRIANCVGKKYIDTGTNANGVAATNTNTTALLTTMNPTSGLCAYPSGSPQGVDGLPCTPNANDDEFTETNPAVGGSNDGVWTCRNIGTTSISLTNGELVFVPQPGAAVDAWRFCKITPPATPYTFVAVAQPVFSNGTPNQLVGMCIGDGTKFVSWTIKATNQGELEVDKWTNVTTFSANSYGLTQVGAGQPWVYFKLQNDGTNLVYSHSWDGVNYFQDFSEAKGAFLGTINEIGFCGESSQTAGTPRMSLDYWRETQ